MPGSRHIPGYAGHIPGLDAGTEKTFGNATAKGLQAHAATVKSFAGNATNMAMNDIPRERGVAADRSPRARTAPVKMEPKVPGYKGFVPGRQHVYARTFGMTTSDLGAAHLNNKQDKNAFINFVDPRCVPSLCVAPPVLARAPASTAFCDPHGATDILLLCPCGDRPGNKDTITMSPGRNHVPGYAGHIPGLDAGATSTFGSSTTSNLLDTASKISASGSKPMNLQKMPIAEIPRERGAPRAQMYDPPTKAEPIGSPGYANEGRLPGYTGFQAGEQHVFAESQGRSTRDLRQAHVKNPSDKNSFVGYGESRTYDRATLTYAGSTCDPVTDKSSNSHVPGYAGHTPTTRDAIGQRFGKATADSLYEKSKKNVWYSGEVSARVPKHQLPREMGLPRETGGIASMPDRNNQLPGYTGFVQHSKDTFAKT
eukprot:COSAG02_NODE_795_length_17133_cov_6.577727_17_plen_426_part_00